MSNKDYIAIHTDESNKMKCVQELCSIVLLLFVGASIGFITNAEWVGSTNHIKISY